MTMEREYSLSRGNDLTVNVWPTTCDCIDWSEDGDIVISAGDEIQLLVAIHYTPPAIVAKRKNQISKIRHDDNLDALWEPIKFRPTTFNAEELPQDDPVPWSVASIGEEISTGEVTSAKWSPPGLAKNGRCALAVHTQNLLLSLWAPASQPKAMKDWKRRALVNQAMRRYFEELNPVLAPEEDEQRPDKLKELMRVRSYAFSPQVITCGESRVPGLGSYIAVANDNNDVVLVSCRASEDNDGEIDLKAECHFSITRKDSVKPALEWTLEDYLNNPRWAQTLAWSPWNQAPDGTFVSLVAFATRKKLAVMLVNLDIEDGEPMLTVGGTKHIVDFRTPWTSDGLLSWLPSSQSSGSSWKLIASQSNKIIAIPIDMIARGPQNGDGAQHQNGHESQRISLKISATVYHRPEWCQIAGQIYLKIKDAQEETVQLLPHTAQSDKFMTTLSLKSMKPISEHSHELQEAIVANREDFDEQVNRGSSTLQTRMWGFVKSPLQDAVATVASVHPANSPEYVISADMYSSVVFEDTIQDDFVEQAMKRRAATELLAQSIKFKAKDMADGPQTRDFVWKLLNQVENCDLGPQVNLLDVETSYFGDLIYESAGLVKRRCDYLILNMLSSKEQYMEVYKQIVETVVSIILAIPSSRYKLTKQSRLLLANLKRARLALSLPAQLGDNPPTEQCDICEANIGFTDLVDAVCDNGHEFTRCSLTFLAIQAPGISRSCGICGKSYLKTTCVEPPDASEASTRTARIYDNEDAETAHLRPLTEMIAEACDRCILCGGKFEG